MEIGRDAAGTLDQQLAEGGRLDTVAAAIEQPDTELVLQCLNAPAQSRLGDEKLLGRTAEVAVAVEGEHVGEMSGLYHEC